MLENRQAELRGRYSFRIGGSTPFQTHLRDLYNQQRSNRNSLCSFFTDAIHFFLAAPAYTYCNAIIGTGKTKTAFVFQIITIIVYLVYLYGLSIREQLPLIMYWTAEQLYALLLLGLSLYYLKRGNWKE